MFLTKIQWANQKARNAFIDNEYWTWLETTHVPVLPCPVLSYQTSCSRLSAGNGLAGSCQRCVNDKFIPFLFQVVSITFLNYLTLLISIPVNDTQLKPKVFDFYTLSQTLNYVLAHTHKPCRKHLQIENRELSRFGTFFDWKTIKSSFVRMELTHITLYFFCVLRRAGLEFTLFATSQSRNIFFSLDYVTGRNNGIRNNHLSIFGTRLSNEYSN